MQHHCCQAHALPLWLLALAQALVLVLADAGAGGYTCARHTITKKATRIPPAPSALTPLLSPLLLPIPSLLSSSGFARIALPVCAGAHTQSAAAIVTLAALLVWGERGVKHPDGPKKHSCC